MKIPRPAVLNLLLIFLLAAATASPIRAPAQAGQRKVFYVIRVEENGFANVTIRLYFSSEGRLTLYLPKNEPVSFRVLSGSGRWLANETDTPYFFYMLSTFEYSPGVDGEFDAKISYIFPYASLIIDNKAWFMSPLIGADDDVTVVVNVTLPFLKRVEITEPPPSYKSDGNYTFIFSGMTSEGRRVSINYVLDRVVHRHLVNRTIDGMEVAVDTPIYYDDLAMDIIEVINDTAPYLEEAFGSLLERIQFKFYLPEGIRGISVYGYVQGEDINLGKEGPVHVNLALIRFFEGYLETTVVHEYIHVALGKVGVDANSQIRWFHEGAAQYFSLRICQLGGINVTHIKRELDRAADTIEPPFDYLQRWTSGPQEGAYYVASYRVIRDLASKYGELDLLRRFSEEAAKYGRVRTNEDLVKVLSLAAGEDLTGYFRNLGFTLVEVDIELPKRPVIVVYIVGAILAVLIISALYIVIRHEKGRKDHTICPFCTARVRRDFRFCPYCGNDLRLAYEWEIGSSASGE